MEQLAEVMVGGSHPQSGRQSSGLPLPALGRLAMAGMVAITQVLKRVSHGLPRLPSGPQANLLGSDALKSEFTGNLPSAGLVDMWE